MGVARMPTHGSCRPVVSMVVALPLASIVRRGSRMLEVGLSAIDTVTSWPVEMPPSTPPLLLETKPCGVISSPCSLPFCTMAQARADLHALHRMDAHHRCGDIGVQAPVYRLAPAHRHTARDDFDARAA